MTQSFALLTQVIQQVVYPQLATLPFLSLLLPRPPPPGDPMDLSAAKLSPTIVWTSSDAANHRIPRNEAEKSAKRNYCFENKLCSWCYDPGHRARVCAEARWNKDKKKSADKKTIIEEEKA